MSISVKTIPCLADNYAFIIHDTITQQTALVDAPEARPIITALSEEHFGLDWILITHHHDDHIQGVEELREAYGSCVVGNKADRNRLPMLDIEVSPGDEIDICGQSTNIVDVSGHTIGHIAYLMPGAAFTADSLMALGCGRVFEGTYDMMWQSLDLLANLPPSTIIYSGHEYTLANGKFALSIESNNTALRDRIESIKEARSNGIPTVPSSLELELATNPFLRARLPEVKDIIGMPDASDSESFAEIRKRKDRF